jgi:predicted nucleotidyltransferase
LAESVNLLEAALRRIAGDLEAAELEWALVGGLAVSARVEPRTTRDVDIAVSVTSDDQAESIIRSLHLRGYRVRATVEHEARKRLASARLVLSSPDEIVVDLLFASSGIEAEVAAAAENLEVLPDFTARVATVGHLLALKVLARDDRTRPQDWDDIRALLREATPADLDVAREALRLIQERGFDRGRPLLQQLDEIIAAP